MLNHYWGSYISPIPKSYLILLLLKQTNSLSPYFSTGLVSNPHIFLGERHTPPPSSLVQCSSLFVIMIKIMYVLHPPPPPSLHMTCTIYLEEVPPGEVPPPIHTHIRLGRSYDITCRSTCNINSNALFCSSVVLWHYNVRTFASTTLTTVSTLYSGIPQSKNSNHSDRRSG